MQTSASPPHAVVIDAPSDSVLLALDPEGMSEESQQPHAKHKCATSDEAEATEQEPRSLQGAVEALAKFTSESVVGEQPPAIIAARMPGFLAGKLSPSLCTIALRPIVQ